MRLYRVEDGEVTDRCEGPGIGMLTTSPEETLRATLAPWCGMSRPTAIYLCGMAGSRGGLHEIAYVDCPADVRDWSSAAPMLAFDDIPLRIAPGLACVDATGRPDVMRGEEAQIFGAIALEAALGQGSSCFVLPGTHSKWVTVEGGRVTGFRTFPTGELFALLRDRSTLLPGGSYDSADEPAGFADGLDRAASGGGLLGSLFEARASQLRAGKSPGWAAGFLSGLIIGNEIADMRDADGLPDNALMIGAAALTARYATALARFGIASREIDGDITVLRGLELIDANG
ncbi:2-dehydro-3-deoxygalactonokinase [Sphingomonas sp. SUN039]|nr:2-dehydro-3-deoxygalactonokinase [Sphingomonas sp. SUN039]